MSSEVDHKAVAALLHGKGCANSLKTLFENRDISSVSTEQLINNILHSISLALSLIDASNHASSSRNMAGLVPRTSSLKRKICGVQSTKYSPTPLLNDGFSWKKYGQKTIKNSPHQRCYYRCNPKDQNCNATKRVQMIQDSPPVYENTTVGDHICKATASSDPSNNYDAYGSKMIQFGKKDHVMSEPVMPQPASVEHPEVTTEDRATDHIINQECDSNDFVVDDNPWWGSDFPPLSPGDMKFFESIFDVDDNNPFHV